MTETVGAAFGIDESQPIRLTELIPTAYSHMISRELMLECINETDIKRVIDSLNQLLMAESQRYLRKRTIIR